jgi:hypothetical protein
MAYTENAPLGVYESIAGMIQVIESLDKSQSGKFFDWRGNEVSW